MQRSILRSPSRIILSSPPSIRHSSSRPSPSFTPSHDESPSTTPSASSYLAQQALLEEEDEELSELIRKKKKRVPVELREPVWEGEETREAMLKRILEDQYKPLRVKGYRKPIPKPSPLPSALFATSPSTSSSSTSSDDPKSPKQPWEYDTSFKPPEHYNPAPGFRSSSLILNPSNLGPGGRHQGRTQIIAKKMVGGDSTSQKKKETVSKLRVFSAYERTLDYKSGNHRSPSSTSGIAISLPPEEELDEFGGGGGDEGAEMAGQMRVWEGFIEEKIKKARKQGLFRNVQGRGKPLPKDEAEGNPFISRNDFLINRIMKTQDAAPPWIELQKELESTLISFRQNLSSSWIRRAIRIRSSEGLTNAVVKEIENGWRDPEWEKKEERYQEAGIRELNELTRKFNIIAPYHVRRPLLTLPSELKRTISLSSSHIASELRRRLQLGLNTTPSTYIDPGLSHHDDGVHNLIAEEMGGEKKEVKESMWKAFRRVLVEVLGKGPDELPVLRRGEKMESR